MNGHIENINRVKAISCDCSKCGHSTKYKLGSQSMIYCKAYKKNNPKKEKCKRFYHKGDLGTKKEIINAKEVTSWEPSFPWEIPVGGR